MTSEETCSYEFDRGAWELTRDRDLRLIEDLPTGWSCDRPVDGADHCLFHRDPSEKDDQKVVERLVEEITTSAADATADAVAENRFVGARFGDCDLTYRILQGEDNRAIDLRFSHVTGKLNWGRTVTTSPVRLSGALVDGDAAFQRIEARADFDLSDTIIRGNVDFSDATIANHLWAINTAFGGEASFDRCTVQGDLCLAGADVGGNLRLASTEIVGTGCFSQIDCHGALVLEPKRIGASVWCVRSEFETFDDEHEPNNLLRGGDVDGDIIVRESSFGDKLTLEHIDVGGRLVFTDTSVASNWVDLTRCSVPAGELGQPDADYVAYDFTDATIGNIRLLDVPGNGFERAYFKNTTFDGFDFGRHRSSLLRSNWTLHTVSEEPPTTMQNGPWFLGEVRDTLAVGGRAVTWFVRSLLGRIEPSADEKSINETTYLKAKNGANQTGDSKAAAEFFKRELTFRRKGHAEVALNGRPDSTDGSTGVLDRLFAAGAWVANVGLALTTGYGEKPHRVVLASLATIFAFTLVFATLPGDGVGGSQSFEGLFILSFQSFVTFVLGSPVGNDVSYAVSFLTALEGFVGAFLVALSVFALTRSVHR